MVGEICDTCGKKKFQFVIVEDGKICSDCNYELQDAKDATHIPITLPEGLVAFWRDSPSYMSKVKNQRYFKIPEENKKLIIDGKEYLIIIREV